MHVGRDEYCIERTMHIWPPIYTGTIVLHYNGDFGSMNMTII